MIDWNKPLIDNHGKKIVSFTHATTYSGEMAYTHVTTEDNVINCVYTGTGSRYQKAAKDGSGLIQNRDFANAYYLDNIEDNTTNYDKFSDAELGKMLHEFDKRYNEVFEELIDRGYSIYGEDGYELATVPIKTISKVVETTVEI